MLARWSSTQHKAADAVGAMTRVAEKAQVDRSNKNFLLRLQAAEQRDDARAGGSQPQASSSPPQERSVLARSGFAAASVPLMRARPGEETHREIELAQKEAKLKERESVALARKLHGPARKLSASELQIASDLFYENDTDASATIDRSEWNALMQELARRTGKPAMSAEESDAAFEEADKDGNGELDLSEWLAAQRHALAGQVSGVLTASPAAARPAANASGAAAGAGMPSSSGAGRSGAGSSYAGAGTSGGASYLDDGDGSDSDTPARPHGSSSKEHSRPGRRSSHSSSHGQRTSSKHEGGRRQSRGSRQRDERAKHEGRERRSSAVALDDSVAEQLKRDWADLDRKLAAETAANTKMNKAVNQNVWVSDELSDAADDSDDERGGGHERRGSGTLPNSWVGSFKRLVGGTASSSFLRRASDVATQAAESFKHRSRRRSSADKERRGADGKRRAPRGRDKRSSGDGTHRRSSSGGKGSAADYVIAVPYSP